MITNAQTPFQKTLDDVLSAVFMTVKFPNPQKPG